MLAPVVAGVLASAAARVPSLLTVKMACSIVLLPLGGVFAFSQTHWNGHTMPASVCGCNTLTADSTTIPGELNQQYTPTPMAW